MGEALMDSTSRDRVRLRLLRPAVKVFGALAVGKLKMKIHKACITRLFGHNDLVLDAETIAEIARDLLMPRG